MLFRSVDPKGKGVRDTTSGWVSSFLQMANIAKRLDREGELRSGGDLLLESALNERFVDESTAYYDNPVKAKEVEDMEQGLNGEFSEDDIKDLIKDKSEHGTAAIIMHYPGRVGSNYRVSDDLSIYKTHPSGSKPAF